MLKLKKIKFLPLFLSVLIAAPVSSLANPPGKVADISKGEKAPFSGVLLSESLATKLYLDSKFSPAECDIRIEKKLGEKDLACKRRVDVLTSKLDIQKQKNEAILGFKNNRITFLEKNWNPRPWYESGEFWFSAGVISGIIVTIASGFALGQISK